MRKMLMAFLGLLMLAISSVAIAQQRVEGYQRRDGTYVQPYSRSTPDSSYNNNWGVQGNQNPYTGRGGTHSPTFNDRPPEYNQRTFGDPGYSNQQGGNRRRY